MCSTGKGRELPAREAVVGTSALGCLDTGDETKGTGAPGSPQPSGAGPHDVPSPRDDRQACSPLPTVPCPLLTLFVMKSKERGNINVFLNRRKHPAHKPLAESIRLIY